VPWLLLCWGVAIIHYFFFHNYFYTLVWLTVLGILLIAQAHYHRTAAGPLQRQQSKWFILGGCVEVIIVVGTIIPPLIFPSLGQSGSFYRPVTALALVVLSFIFPICIGVGILRYRLYDIDIIIGRTLVYGTLTVCVIGVYVLVVGGLGMLIGTSGNLLISLLATGLVAVLFQPLRAALQRWVNRLLYGQRDEPYTVITRLSQRLKNTLAPEAILLTIVETVAQALKLPYVAIFLKQGNAFRLAASTGKLMGEPLVLPLIYQAETIGHLRLAPRAPGEPFTPADRRLLDELSRQAGLAVHAVRLHEDLQRSYEQLEQRVAERTRELSSLLEISHTVAATLHLKPLLGLILDQLKLVIDYTGASILTVEGDYLVFLDHQGPIPQEQLTHLRISLAELGPIWHMFATESSILIDDVYEETELARTWHAATKDLLTTSFQPMHAWMALPLMRKDRLIGILVLAASEKQFFTQHHATLALAIANQAAIAIENARLYEQAQELAALEERQKLARELHDSVSQALYGIALGTHTARKLLERDPSLVAEQLEYILTLTKAGLAEMRALIFELRPESLETEGLVSALLKQVAALKARHDIAIETDLCDEPNLSLKAKQELYRVAQEALHNAMKHASASLVQVKLNWTDDAIILEIHDNGRGFNPQDSFPGHLGLLSMQERVKKLLGNLSIESAPDQGTTIRARIPTREVIHT
jgi:signal transduction histidine kinase